MPDAPLEPSPRLIVLAPSHFCERARWGLDHAALRYTEQAWAPLLHLPLARRLAKASTLPILVVRVGEVIQGSGAILSWAGLKSDAELVERRLEKRTGPLVRRYVYSGVLHDPRAGVRDILLHGVPPWQARVARTAWPAIRQAMSVSMKVGPAKLVELEQALERELDWIDAIVSEGPYLDGDQFGRTDITAASLLAPLARPVDLPLYRQLVMPAEVERAFQRWADRPSIRWVLRMYAAHRN
ncbi:glutathione S-transferase family protein [Methylobacterium soli]|uniref:Glutathione S-transferase family protein n=1 Tax=Methylobacterium soli TaxID=553447 RepID=A0A6L3SYX0_9HYPH|nr:glutathione S-transferase N-terminal domain-containing protein [Methylobacterium soli]KAB1079319.1 glutathione S-transferase family protein [Methylobacterium soli]GJE45784.1 hypothetical protein AEGHOMDF_4984 [Methylobacterium soli]